MKKFILSVVALFLLSAFLRAQEIDMSGSVAYDAVGSLVTLALIESIISAKISPLVGPLPFNFGLQLRHILDNHRFKVISWRKYPLGFSKLDTITIIFPLEFHFLPRQMVSTMWYSFWQSGMELHTKQ